MPIPNCPVPPSAPQTDLFGDVFEDPLPDDFFSDPETDVGYWEGVDEWVEEEDITDIISNVVFSEDELAEDDLGGTTTEDEGTFEGLFTTITDTGDGSGSDGAEGGDGGGTSTTEFDPSEGGSDGGDGGGTTITDNDPGVEWQEPEPEEPQWEEPEEPQWEEPEEPQWEEPEEPQWEEPEEPQWEEPEPEPQDNWGGSDTSDTSSDNGGGGGGGDTSSTSTEA